MAGNHRLSNDMKRRAAEMKQFVKVGLPSIMEVEGLNHFRKSFKDEGFTDDSLVTWKKRKTTDSKGRNKLTYKTNRRGRQGSLTQFGRRNKNRPVLTGFNSGNNKLRNSLRARRRSLKVIFFTYKPYAKVHNEGDRNMPKRMFMGPSKSLNNKIERKAKPIMDKILR